MQQNMTEKRIECNIKKKYYDRHPEFFNRIKDENDPCDREYIKERQEAIDRALAINMDIVTGACQAIIKIEFLKALTASSNKIISGKELFVKTSGIPIGVSSLSTVLRNLSDSVKSINSTYKLQNTDPLTILVRPISETGWFSSSFDAKIRKLLNSDNFKTACRAHIGQLSSTIGENERDVISLTLKSLSFSLDIKQTTPESSGRPLQKEYTFNSTDKDFKMTIIVYDETEKDSAYANQLRQYKVIVDEEKQLGGHYEKYKKYKAKYLALKKSHSDG
jgi:hypothetical protein